MSDEDGYFLIVIGLGLIALILCSIIVSFDRNVNIEEFGRLACESQGLAYQGFHWHESKNNVPVIECVDPPVSIVDGVVVKVASQKKARGLVNYD